MSYVLDALRKSEQERQMAAGPAACLLYPVAVEHRRGPHGTAALAGAAALVLGVLGLAIWPWIGAPQPLPAAAAVAQLAAAANAAAVAERDVPAASAPAAAVPARVSAAVVPAAVAVASMSAPDSPTGRSGRATAKKSAAARRAAAASPDESGRADRLAQVLPDLRVAGYIRDENGATLAMINDRLVREGDEVGPGVRLEKIQWDGSVFSHNGQRFRR